MNNIMLLRLSITQIALVRIIFLSEKKTRKVAVTSIHKTYASFNMVDKIVKW